MTLIKNFFNPWTIFALSVIAASFFLNLGIVNEAPITKWFYIGTVVFVFVMRYVQLKLINKRINGK